MTARDTSIASQYQTNPLSRDLALFDMYTTALDAVLAKPEIVIAMNEFELSQSTLRMEMMLQSGAVLKAAASEFAAYQEAFARHNEVEGDAGLITYRSRRDSIRMVRLLSGGYGAGGVILLLAGLASMWFWAPAAALAESGAALLVAAAAILGFLRWLGTEPGRALMERLARRDDGIELALARSRLITATHSELAAQARNQISVARQRRFGHKYLVSDSPGLSEVYDSINRVPTETAEELEDVLARLNGASIGVAGPRGCGKSMLIRDYCEDSGLLDELHIESGGESMGGAELPLNSWGNLRCMVAAPVDYAAKDFVLHLFATFCQTFIRSCSEQKLRELDDAMWHFSWLAPARDALSSLLLQIIFFGGIPVSLLHWQNAISRQFSIPVTWIKDVGVALIFLGAAAVVRSFVRHARKWTRRSDTDELLASAKKQLAKVRYLQTQTSGLSGGLSFPGGITGQLTHGISRAEQPLSYPEIVDEFRRFARMVAARAHQRGFRVFIGIDELDKIGSPEQAEHFLNEIKGIFGIPYVYFIVSVSNDALTAFERRGLPLRDAFDSSFDEIIHVGPLHYAESRRLLYRRMAGISEPYVALCHCLAGGLARDLIRAARTVVRTATSLMAPLEGSESSDSSDDPVEYLLASELPKPGDLTIDTITEAVIHDELRRKARAVSLVASDARSLETTEFQDLLYNTASRVSPGESIDNVIGSLTRPCAAESATIAGLRLEFAAYAYYCATLLDMFNGQLDIERIIEASNQPENPGSFDTLAGARNAFTLNTMLAWRLITEFRSAWSMETREPPSGLPASPLGLVAPAGQHTAGEVVA